MKLVTLGTQDLVRYGLEETDLPISYFTLGLEEEGIPLAYLLAIQTEDGWEVPVLECLHQWSPDRMRRLLTGLTVWAKSSGIAHLTLQAIFPREQAKEAGQMLTQSGWSLGSAAVRLSLRTGYCPPQRPSPSPHGTLLPFAQLPLSTRARFFAAHPQADLPSMGTWEPGLSVACLQGEQVDGCILTASQTRQLAAQAWLPPQQETAVDLLCLWLALCRRRQIPLLTLQTDQMDQLALIQDLFSDGISGADVTLRAQWPKGE